MEILFKSGDKVGWNDSSDDREIDSTGVLQTIKRYGMISVVVSIHRCHQVNQVFFQEELRLVARKMLVK